MKNLNHMTYSSSIKNKIFFSYIFVNPLISKYFKLIELPGNIFNNETLGLLHYQFLSTCETSRKILRTREDLYIASYEEKKIKTYFLFNEHWC